MEKKFCGACNSFTNYILDHKTSEITCSVCMSLISHSQNTENPIPTNIFVSSENQILSGSNGDTHMSTATAAAPIRGCSDIPIITGSNHSRRKKNPNKGLSKGYRYIDEMSSKLSNNDVELIKTRAKEIFRSGYQLGICIGRKIAAIAAACLFWACREVKFSCGFKEIYNVSNCHKKTINKMIRKIKEYLGQDLVTAQTSEIVSRFCSKLEMAEIDVMAVQDAVTLSEQIKLRKTSELILGGIIYLIAQISDNKKSLQDIASAFEVNKQAMEKVYRDLHPHRAKLVPQWFAAEKDYENIQDL